MAATNTTRFSDQQYRNWLKDTLSLLYLKEALEDIVDIDAIQFHQGLQKALGVFGAAPSTCSSCTQNSIIKDFRRRKWWMTCSLCDQWLQHIVQNHANQPLPSLHTENTDPQLWPTNPYEVFKCYMPYGCQQDQSAVDGDVQSILKLIQNCLHFSTCGRIGRLDLVDKLLEIRNSLFHSGNFLVADPKLKADMQTMLDFLRGLKALSGVEQNAVDEAIYKILQLQANKIDLSLNRELELRALQQQQIALEKDLGTLQKEVKSAEVKGATTDLAVKNIQAELGTHTTKLSTVESDMKILQKAVTSATAKSSASELDIKTLREKTKGLELHKQQVEGLQDQFRRFLQANGLEQDLARFSTAMDKQGQTLEEHAKLLSGLENTRGNQETRLQSQQATLADHDTRLQSHDARFADHDTRLQSHDTSLADHDTRLHLHDTSLADYGAQLQSHNTSLADHGAQLQSHNTSLADHDTQLQSHDTSLADHGAQLQSHNTSLADHDTRLQSHDTSLADHGTQLQLHDTSLADHGTQLQSHDTSLADHDTRLQSHDTSLADHRTQLQSHNTSLADHDTRLQSHDTSLADHGAQLQSTQKKIATIEEAMGSQQTGSDTGQMTEAEFAALQKRLIEYYRTMFLTDPEDDVGLNLVYVDPDIRVLREKDPSRGLVSVEDQAGVESQCRRLFHAKDNSCKQIYITGDAGSGKSMFCKHLLSLWCEAHGNTAVSTTSNRDCSENGASRLQIGDPNRGDERKFGQRDNTQKDENKKIMSEFPLLFYITLRDVSDMYHVEEMIDDQIFQQNDDMQHFKASVVLKKCCCLVILDGLDEWVRPTNVKPLRGLNPGIPGRNMLNKSNVFLTTTRPWKLDVLCHKRSEIYMDKHVELVGFNSVASKTLYSQLCHLFDKPELVHAYGSFCAKLKKRGMINTPHNIPVILTQLMCLCLNGKDLNLSQVHMYCRMLEMLLEQSDKNMPDPTCTTSPKTEHSGKLLPACFSQYPVCQTHQNLLDTLCKVAFEALFNEEKEKSLVFKSSQMTIFGVVQKDIDLCLNSGILSQNKVLGKRLVHEKKMSFLHKKLQEFLAAIFITNSEGGENVLSRVKSYCSTVEKMLEMSQICMFVSGLNIEVACKLLTYFMTHVVCNDTAVQQYRQNTDSPRYTCIHSIQTCIVDCSIEALNNQHSDNLPLQDFIIDRQTISECLKRLLVTNISAVKSVYIDTGLMTPDDVEFAARTLHQLQDKQCLQKLYLYDPDNVNFDDKTLCKTITNNSNLSSLVLWYISLSTETSAAVCGALKHLTALELYEVKLPHEEKQRLLSSVSQAAALRQLTLQWLYCTDHGRYCSPGIDISQLNTSCLQHITLLSVTIQDRQLRQFVRQLSSVSHKVTVHLDLVTVTADSENPVDLSYLTHDRCLVVTVLWNIRDNIWSIDFHTQQQTTT